MATPMRTTPMLALLLCCATAPAAVAQTAWLEHAYDEDLQTYGSAEWRKPSFAESSLSFLSSVLLLQGQVALSPRAAVVLALPITHADGGFGGEESSTGFANPYLGVRYREPGSGAQADLGAWIPAGDGPSSRFIGLRTDFDRYPAYLDRTLTVRGQLAYQAQAATGAQIQAHVAPALLLYRDAGGSSPDVQAGYGLRGWYEGTRLRAGLGVTGMVWLSGEDLSLSERTIHHLGLHATGALGGVQPSLSVQIPVDEAWGEGLNFVVALGVAVPIR